MDDELEMLRRIVTGLILCSGRLTSDQSMELDYCWDMAEEYVKERHPEAYNGPVF